MNAQKRVPFPFTLVVHATCDLCAWETTAAPGEDSEAATRCARHYVLEHDGKESDATD